MNKKISKFFCTAAFGTLLLVGCNSEEPDTQEQQETQQSTNESESVEPSETKVTKEEIAKDNNGVTSVNFEGITFDLPNYAEKLDLGEQQLPMEAYLLDGAVGTSFNIVLEPLAESLTLEEYMGYATANTGFEYLSEEYYTSNDIEWNEVVSYNHTQQGTLQLNQRTFMIDDQVYIFTYASTPENYEQHLQDFVNITESVTMNQ